MSRLTSKLAQMQQERGKAGNMDADLDAGVAAPSQHDWSGELKWDQVQPLLTEYDGMIYSLQAKLSERQEELGRFESKLDDISRENAALVDKLKHALKEITTTVCCMHYLESSLLIPYRRCMLDTCLWFGCAGRVLLASHALVTGH